MILSCQDAIDPAQKPHHALIQTVQFYRATSNRLDRCHLKGQLGDALHAVLCAAGYNLRWLMRAMIRLGLKALLSSRYFHAAFARLAPKRAMIDWHNLISANIGAPSMTHGGVR